MALNQLSKKVRQHDDYSTAAPAPQAEGGYRPKIEGRVPHLAAPPNRLTGRGPGSLFGGEGRSASWDAAAEKCA